MLKRQLVDIYITLPVYWPSRENKNKWNKRQKNTIYEIHVSFLIISSISIFVEALLALSESISFFNIF